MLTSVAGPVSRASADSLLKGTPVSLADLVRLGLLREEAGRFRLNYLVLTTSDQRMLYEVAQRFGADLARAIRSRGADFDRFAAWYPETELRETLEFDLIAGMLLNWDGLRLTTELGYRAAPISHEGGDAYLFHSKEAGANLALAGLYWGSESWPGRAMTVTTLGDAESFPRLHGLPNVYDGPFEEGLAPLRRAPALYGAARRQLLAYVGLAVDDAGDVLAALAASRAGRAALLARGSIPAARLDATLDLLEAINYICRSGDEYHINVPVLIERDRAIVDSTLTVGRDILTRWLGQNVNRMKRELTNLSPLRNGLPFALVFSELWHYVFGFATKWLAESGFLLNPRGAGRVAVGYVPFVWANSLYSF